MIHVCCKLLHKLIVFSPLQYHPPAHISPILGGAVRYPFFHYSAVYFWWKKENQTKVSIYYECAIILNSNHPKNIKSTLQHRQIRLNIWLIHKNKWISEKVERVHPFSLWINEGNQSVVNISHLHICVKQDDQIYKYLSINLHWSICDDWVSQI